MRCILCTAQMTTGRCSAIQHIAWASRNGWARSWLRGAHVTFENMATSQSKVPLRLQPPHLSNKGSPPSDGHTIAGRYSHAFPLFRRNQELLAGKAVRRKN
ncbi:hypothetical protein DL89DRAFT_64193 [Linderina pennispora]|uniref:Uncharacterized protein n=1 Tax=Linderina pennispora TaxID=61395 RepID=A0A1Y1VYZ8_9FUNG|nr:uncharacterized protein DL89DRAFT_64193 [Linderina pennispora]ORX66491.1 hypothetical protein DL89DRAFT_64193 [Linderina pennispora]